MNDLEFVRAIASLRDTIAQLAAAQRNMGAAPSPVALASTLVTRPFECPAIGGANQGQAVQVLPNDPRRVYLLIQNNSTANLLVGIDSAPGSATQCLILGPGNFWEPQVCPTNAIYVLSVSLARAPGVAIFGTR